MRAVESGVAVRIPIPPVLRRLRRQHDEAAALGVPPHVTVLYPFLPPDRLTPSVRSQLAALAAAHTSFQVRLTAVGRWPTVVYLRAEPADRLVALTMAIAARWPEFPPYGGAHAELVPPLTVCETDDPARLDVIERGLTGIHLPILAWVDRLEVLSEGDDGRWRLCWRLPLGPASGRR